LTRFIRFDPADPACFRVGDIVEAQMTVVAVPIKRDRFKMITQLRSLALIDSTYSQVGPHRADATFVMFTITKAGSR